MSQIPVLGRDKDGGNPLIILALAVEKQTEVLREIAENTRPGKHEYALMHVGEDSWMSYCVACSDLEQRAVHPCKVLDENDTPPPPSTFQVAPPPASPLD